MRETTKSLALAGLVLLSAVLGVGAAAAAGDAGVTDVEVLNKTVSVDADTEDLRVIAENITNGTASVTVFGVNETGAETQVSTGTLNTSLSGTTTATATVSGVNATKYPEYRVLVEGDNASDTVSVNKVQVVAAGGGVFGGAATSSTAMLVLAAGAVGAALLLLRD
jgi:hypothetical protein